MLVSRAGVPERWGYRADWRRLLLTRAIDRLPAGTHQIDYYQRLVAALGFVNGPSAPRLELAPAVREAGALLRRAGWDGGSPLVAIAPGAVRIGEALAGRVLCGSGGGAEDGVTTVLVGAAADRATAAEVTRDPRGRATLIDVVGQTDIPTLAGVLANCRALMANDSGALHLGAALGLRVTAAFGPTEERTSAPRGATVLRNPTWCRGCGLRECPLDHSCMTGIPAAAALTATRKYL
jgi:heptosyltransferase-2